MAWFVATDVLTSEYKFTTLQHTINITALRISLCVSAHLLHLIFWSSLWLYYSLRFPYVDPIIMVALIISPQRAVTSQSPSAYEQRSRYENPKCSSDLVLLPVLYISSNREWTSDAPSLRLSACHIFPSLTAFCGVPLLALRIAFAETR